MVETSLMSNKMLINNASMADRFLTKDLAVIETEEVHLFVIEPKIKKKQNKTKLHPGITT